MRDLCLLPRLAVLEAGVVDIVINAFPHADAAASLTLRDRGIEPRTVLTFLGFLVGTELGRQRGLRLTGIEILRNRNSVRACDRKRRGVVLPDVVVVALEVVERLANHAKDATGQLAVIVLATQGSGIRSRRQGQATGTVGGCYPRTLVRIAGLKEGKVGRRLLFTKGRVRHGYLPGLRICKAGVKFLWRANNVVLGASKVIILVYAVHSVLIRKTR